MRALLPSPRALPAASAVLILATALFACGGSVLDSSTHGSSDAAPPTASGDAGNPGDAGGPVHDASSAGEADAPSSATLPDAATSPPTTNFVADAGAEAGQVNPWGWYLVAGSSLGSYAVNEDWSVLFDGQSTAHLASKTPGLPASASASLGQAIPAAPYAGKRLRLTSYVKTANVTGWAGAWMEVDGASSVLASDNMSNRPIHGTNDFTPYTVVLDVAAGAMDIAFGASLTGSGELWIGGTYLDVVDTSVPTTG